MMTDREPSLDGKVARWLAKEGYRLEYLTHIAFQKTKARSTLGFYIESTEGKRREIDVTASVQIPDAHPPVIIRVLCECKYSRENPWVLLSSGLTSDLFLDWISIPKSAGLRRIAHTVHRYAKHLRECWHFAEGHRFAHSLVQAFKSDNRDAAFDALQKIANAAWDYVDRPGQRGHPPAYLVAFPCLIVEAPLYFAWFDPDADRFAVKQVPYGRVSWSGCRFGTIVDVVHVSALQDYAGATSTTLEAVLRVVETMIREHR